MVLQVRDKMVESHLKLCGNNMSMSRVQTETMLQPTAFGGKIHSFLPKVTKTEALKKYHTVKVTKIVFYILILKQCRCNVILLWKVNDGKVSSSS